MSIVFCAMERRYKMQLTNMMIKYTLEVCEQIVKKEMTVIQCPAFSKH